MDSDQHQVQRSRTPRRVVQIGMVLLALTAIHYVLRSLMASPLFPPSHIPLHGDYMLFNNSSASNTTIDQDRVNKNENASSHIIKSLQQHLKPGLNKMAVAVAKIKAVAISPTFWYSNDVYFHPPEATQARDFFPFLINPADTCSGIADSGKGIPFLMVLVLSSYREEGSRERQAIRTTYGSVVRGKRWPGNKPLAAPVGMVFVLGRPPTAQAQQTVEAESTQYGDLLVVDFVDSYNNLTLKVLHGLHWAIQHCPRAKFVLKADDDVFVNLPLLTAFLVQRGHNNSVYGHAYFTGMVFRTGRWAVSWAEYPVSMFPVYMSGTAYSLSMDAAQKIVKASHRLPLFPIEDAFITGVLAQISGVERVSCSGFTSFVEERAHDCEFVSDQRIVGNHMAAEEKLSLWVTLNSDLLSDNCLL